MELAVVGLGAVAVHGVARGDDRPGRTGPRGDGRGPARGRSVNINQAGKGDLMTLAGVGAGTAERIIAHRQRHGPFRRPQDLEKVEGIGKGVLERDAGRIVVR
jgi:competence protein ComEA